MSHLIIYLEGEEMYSFALTDVVKGILIDQSCALSLS